MRIPDRGDVVELVFLLEQLRLTEQIAEGNAERASQLSQLVDPRWRPVATLDFREPIGATPDQAGQDLLRVPAAATVERDAFAEAQMVASSPRG